MTLGVWNTSGSVFVVLSLTLTILGFSTNNWMTFSVSKERYSTLPASNKTKAAFYGVSAARNRGLLKECYGATPGYLENSGRKASASCAWIEYEIPANASYKSFSNEYKMRIHCLRLAPISLSVTMLLLFIALVSNIFSGCCSIEARVAMAACVLCLLSFLMLAAALAGFFVAFETYELKEVKDNWFFWAAWPSTLKSATSYRYDWSLWVTVAALPCTFIAAIFYLIDYKTNTGFGSSRRLRKYKRHDGPSVHVQNTYPGHSDYKQSGNQTGRVIKQQVLPRTIDPYTGREVAPHINDGYDYSDDNSFKGTSAAYGRQHHERRAQPSRARRGKEQTSPQRTVDRHQQYYY